MTSYSFHTRLKKAGIVMGYLSVHVRANHKRLTEVLSEEFGLKKTASHYWNIEGKCIKR
jgi:hypothetical protein